MESANVRYLRRSLFSQKNERGFASVWVFTHALRKCEKAILLLWLAIRIFSAGFLMKKIVSESQYIYIYIYIKFTLSWMIPVFPVQFCSVKCWKLSVDGSRFIGSFREN